MSVVCRKVVPVSGERGNTAAKPGLHLLLLEDNESDANLLRRQLLAEWPDCRIVGVSSGNRVASLAYEIVCPATEPLNRAIPGAPEKVTPELRIVHVLPV